MNIQLLYLCGFLTLAVPFFAVAAAFSHYLLQRRSLRRRRRFERAIPGLYPASMALGMVFLLVQTFYRPSVSYAVEARVVEDAGEIDEGDEETLAKQLNRQLRAVPQFTCTVRWCARWPFLEENATRHRAFGVQQLENRCRRIRRGEPLDRLVLRL